MASDNADKNADGSDDARLGVYVDTTAQMLGLTIADDWRDDVLFHFKTLTAAARLLETYPLDDALEQAPVFRA